MTPTATDTTTVAMIDNNTHANSRNLILLLHQLPPRFIRPRGGVRSEKIGLHANTDHMSAGLDLDVVNRPGIQPHTIVFGDQRHAF